MRRRIVLPFPSAAAARAFTACALAVASVLATAPARAGDCSGIRSPCINDDTLWPDPGAGRFVGVGAAETVAAHQVGFGLVTSYLSRPIILHVQSPGPPGSDQYAIDDQVNGTFLWAYGVTDRLQLDLAVPLTFGQGGTGLAPLTGGAGLKDTAVRDMRFGFAYALVPHARIDPTLPASSPAARRNVWGLVGRLEVSAPTGDSDQFAGDRSGVFVPSLAGDYRRGRWYAGLEVGARVRPTTELLGARVGTQLYTALGVGFDVLPRELLSAQLEAWALPTLDQQADATQPSGQVTVATLNGKYMVPAEWQLSARSAPLPGGELSFVLGGGGGLPITSDALTMPRFRFTLGVRWAPMARDTDGDGIPDAVDRCPSVPAPGTPDGCVPVASAAGPVAPAVDLHLASSHDACKDEPDLVDGFRDDDGCPDEDQDKDGVDDRFDKCPLVPEDFAGLTDGCPDKK